tara:strand:+ start:259 stop:651 length:393 start_codon:yes stop_codon:yes gene_type:complete
MVNQTQAPRYRVEVSVCVSSAEPSRELNWPVDTMGEAKAFIEGYKEADRSHIVSSLTYSFKVIEIRDVVAVVSIHTKSDGDRDVCSHTSEEEAVKHLEYLKSECGLFNDDLDDYDWHYVTIKTEHEVEIK